MANVERMSLLSALQMCGGSEGELQRALLLCKARVGDEGHKAAFFGFAERCCQATARVAFECYYGGHQDIAGSELVVGAAALGHDSQLYRILAGLPFELDPKSKRLTVLRVLEQAGFSCTVPNGSHVPAADIDILSSRRVGDLLAAHVIAYRAQQMPAHPAGGAPAAPPVVIPAAPAAAPPQAPAPLVVEEAALDEGEQFQDAEQPADEPAPVAPAAVAVPLVVDVGMRVGAKGPQTDAEIVASIRTLVGALKNAKLREALSRTLQRHAAQAARSMRSGLVCVAWRFLQALFALVVMLVALGYALMRANTVSGPQGAVMLPMLAGGTEARNEL